MPISSLYLEAFLEVARVRSFSGAAKNLHVTQSALSQRVINLESDLKTGLIVRDPSGLRLTPMGEELFRYCQAKETLENEFLERLGHQAEGGGGIIRIAGFSTVVRSIVIKAMSEMVMRHHHLNVEIFSRELRELPSMLSNNEVDWIVTSQAPSNQEIESHLLGYEENVLIESVRVCAKKDIYLDHDRDDQTTISYFKLNGQVTKLRRNYLDEIYAIIDGVSYGWGRAVVPKHLVKDFPGVKIIRGSKPLKVPVMLQYFRQPYYSKLHALVVEQIGREAPRLLGK